MYLNLSLAYAEFSPELCRSFPPLFFGSSIFFFKVLGVSAYARRKFSSKWDCVGLIFCRCFCFCFCLRLRVGKGICWVQTQHRTALLQVSFSTPTQHMLSFFCPLLPLPKIFSLSPSSISIQHMLNGCSNQSR